MTLLPGPGALVAPSDPTADVLDARTLLVLAALALALAAGRVLALLAAAIIRFVRTLLSTLALLVVGLGTVALLTCRVLDSQGEAAESTAPAALAGAAQQAAAGPAGISQVSAA